MSGVSDPIADLLTRLRNAISAKLRYIDVGTSKMKIAIVEILKQQGYVDNYLIKQDGSRGTMRVFIRYGAQRTAVIQGLKRVSRPGLRRYVAHTELPKVLGGIGIAIISTSHGVMSCYEARKRKIGGELLCYIW
jgi:small subunit ribosomal protein S8